MSRPGAAGRLALATLALAGCGTQRQSARQSAGAAANRGLAATATRRPAPAQAAALVVSPPRLGPSWTAAATLGGEPIVWTAQRAGVTMVRFDQAHTRLILHAGSAEPESGGWRYGSQISAFEVHRILAAFNGGFKLNYGSVGFMAGGRVAVPLTAGLGSIVTYTDGRTQIGAWRQGVPASGQSVDSVLQDLGLLIDNGVPAASVQSCPLTCWGATLGGGVTVARSALGITGSGQLVWGAGESLSPSALAQAMASVGVQRAVELDINPQWVAGYLYLHHREGPAAAPLVPGQSGIPGELLAPYSRDFFTVIAR